LIVFNDWASQEVNLYDGVSTVEVEWIVGPIPIDGNISKEVIIRYDTDIKSASKYYTDANGREVLERIRDYRPTWNYTVLENVSGNYYPISSRIWIKDQQRQFTVLTGVYIFIKYSSYERCLNIFLDRSQGGGSIRDGSVEIMVHRRILNICGGWFQEPLNETAYGKGLVVRGKHLLIIETPNNSAMVHRTNAQQLYMQPISTFSLINLSYADYSTNYRQTWSALVDTMPRNLHLLTLDQLAAKQYLIRVEHYFELNEDPIYSQPIQIDLQQLFHSLGQITDVIELTLTANMPLAEMKRLNWTTTEHESSHWNTIGEFLLDINTFLISLLFN
jgi:lysosomal alpha-mannosidase